MNKFQIADQNNEPISLNELDRQAALFWGVELQDKVYACPDKGMINWFDRIGWSIAHQGRFTTGWDNVKLALLQGTIEFATYRVITKEQNDFSISTAIEWCKPYLDLIDYWAGCGYKPIQIV